MTTVAIIRRSVRPLDGHDSLYEVTFECADFAGASAGGGNPGEFPPGGACDVDNVEVVQSASASVTSPGAGEYAGASWDDPPTEGNLLLCIHATDGNQGNTPGTLTGWTRIEGDSFTGGGGAGGKVWIYWKLAEDSEDTTPTTTGGNLSASNLDDNNAYLIEVAGVDAFDVSATDHSEDQDFSPGVPITPTEGLVAFIITVQEHHQTLVGAPPVGGVRLFHEGSISDGGNPARWIGYRIVDGTTGTYDVNPEPPMADDKSWTSLTAVFYCAASSPDLPCILPGQPSAEDEAVEETPDGSITTFTTRCPFADNTLRVKVDNTDQTAAVTSYDGAAGTFTLGFAPSTGMLVTVKYLGR